VSQVQSSIAWTDNRPTFVGPLSFAATVIMSLLYSMTWYLLPMLLLLLVAASVLRDWRQSGRLFCAPLPRPLRNRHSQVGKWKQICPDGTIDKADALLLTLCEAFSFNPDDRYTFAPTDRLVDVYRACYPRWKFWNVGDNMEIESLMLELSRKYAVDDEGWSTDITLGEIVGMIQSPPEDDRRPENEEK
jgi:hypothetical protein